MPTIVEQLQLDALNPAVMVGDLLRRAKLTASKLGLKSVESWIESELDGYREDPPPYRFYKGTLWGLNPIRGWIPIGGDPRIIGPIISGATIQPLPVLEKFIQSEDRISIEVDYDHVRLLNEFVGVTLPRYRVEVSSGFVIEMISNVRNKILEWSLDLERKGILGQEFSFTLAEKAKAKDTQMSITIGSIGNFTGNLGRGNSSGDITWNNESLAKVADIVAAIRPHIDSISGETSDRERIKALFSELEHAIRLSNPSPHKISRLMIDLRNALSGAAGSLLASGALAQINHFLSSVGISL